MKCLNCAVFACILDTTCTQLLFMNNTQKAITTSFLNKHLKNTDANIYCMYM